MGWKEKLQPASFRGVPFSVEYAPVIGGRNIVIHQFPGQDNPHNEDLSKKPREFPIDGFIVGENFVEQSEKLISAFEEAGPGILVHPWHGRVLVSVPDYHIGFGAKDGRMCTVSFQCIRATETTTAISKEDPFSRLVNASQNANAVSKESFTNKFVVSGYPAHVSSSAINTINTIQKIIKTVKVQALKSAEYNQLFTNFSGNVNNLLLSPGGLVDTLSNLIVYNFGLDPYSYTATINDLWEIVALFNIGNDWQIISSDTPSMIQAATNQIALRDLLQNTAIISAARISVDLSYSSYNEAILIRNKITDAIDSKLETISEDKLFVQFLELKASVVKNIEFKAGNLSRLQNYIPRQTMSSLVLSHELYGNIDMESDIINRNNIRNPMFIGGESTLEVLSYE